MKAQFKKGMHCLTSLEMPRRYSIFLIILLVLVVSCSHLPFLSTETSAGQYGVPFDNVPDTADIIMYEINPLVFSASGDLNGVKSRLESLRDLGVNVVWLMPIHPIGELNGVGSPYAVRDFTAVNPRYGSLEDLRALVSEAHKLDMAVIMDWVPNHTSWDNPWVTEHRDWYTQENGEIIHPKGTNWRDVADLNYDNTAMRSAMIEAMKYWILFANIDGYRLDHADGVPSDFWRQALETLNDIPNRDILMLAEGAKLEHFSTGFEMIYDWKFYDSLISVFNKNAPVSTLLKRHIDDYKSIPEGKYTLRFTSNHDKCAWEQTPLEAFRGKDGSMAAFVLTAYMGSVPLLYNGQEVGCSERLPFFSSGRTKIDWSINPDMTAEYENIIRFRKNSKAVKTGRIETYDMNPDVAVFKRISQDEEVLVFVNVRDTAKEYNLPSPFANTAWTDAFTDKKVTLQTSVTLQPFEYMILRNE